MNAKPNLAGWNVSIEDFPADGGADQKLVALLSYAILAPSSHNTQPWLFRVNGHDLDVLSDTRRALPVVDPLDRELIMSCGAAVHHLRVAARHFGHDSRIELFPDLTEPNLVARFSLGHPIETTAPEIMLFNAILKRRTNRRPFLPDPVPESLLEALEHAAAAFGVWLHFFRDEESRFRAADLVAEADLRQWPNREFRRELSRWLAPNNSGRRDGIPGYAHGRGNLASKAEPLIVRTFDLGRGLAARDRDIALYSPVLAVLGTAADTRVDWMRAGQALSAVLLRARVEDVWASFLNQTIEVAETRDALGALTNRAGYPQILLRLGFGQEVPPTPRRSVRQVLLKSRDVPIRIG
jgi:hypothetical protein